MESRVSLLTCCQRAVMAGFSLLLAACATTKDNVDPYEGYNRAIFHFNRTLDYAVGRPVADLYDTLIPAPVQGGVSRMYDNFYEPSRVINDILQGEMRYAGQDSLRFVVNSTVGLVGFFDVAQYWGLPFHQQDFGITMARWGWKQSAYIVVPILGFYTFRDLAAVPFNTYVFTFWPYIQPENLAWKLYFLEKIYTRAELRPADKAIDEAFDPYIFIRDAYLQKRAEAIKTQQTGRSSEVQPSSEVAEEQPKTTEAGAVRQSGGTSTQKDSAASVSVKPASGKSLPDVLSLEKNQPIRASASSQSQGKTEEPDIIS